ncbi:hypothetical protein [Halomonas sp. DWK9]|uniref:hypothetical protein n=1 Tax=Halomonas sp. DWK9 TaxID=3060155 RepID=UPI00287F855E|nr:hypothetical protein [Halomonas sp. DWK9]
MADFFVQGERRQALRWPLSNGLHAALLLLTLMRYSIGFYWRTLARQAVREVLGTCVCNVPCAQYAA